MTVETEVVAKARRRRFTAAEKTGQPTDPLAPRLLVRIQVLKSDSAQRFGDTNDAVHLPRPVRCSQAAPTRP